MPKKLFEKFIISPKINTGHIGFIVYQGVRAPLWAQPWTKPSVNVVIPLVFDL